MQKTLKGDSGPTTVLSKFGWLLSGPLRDSVTSNTVTPSLITSGDCSFISHENEELMNNQERFWQTEAIGIHEIKDASLTKEEFLDVKHNGERERGRLSRKNDCLAIPNNLNLCYNGLKSMHRKLSKTPDVLKENDYIIQEQLTSGIIKKVPNPEVERRNSEIVKKFSHKKFDVISSTSE